MPSRATSAPREPGAKGRFNKSVVPVKDINGLTILDHDEHMRPDAQHAVAGQLKPVICADGRNGWFRRGRVQRYPEIEAINYVHHAGNSSGIVDGSAAVLLGSKEAGGKAMGLEAARAHPGVRLEYRLGAGDHADRPGRRDREAAQEGRMTIKDIDLFELNEAFASVVLRYMQAFDIPHDRINVNGGAIAMGHPLGATGAMFSALCSTSLSAAI
jgi:acetyl-CoA C-acetyltransferase